jgi:CopG antitoxin of type II toxin-antitoxin system
MASTKAENQTAAARRIPTFRSIEEAAEFWDSHDSAEFEDEFEEVTDVRMIGLLHDGRLILWLEPEQAAALRRQAKEQGTYPATLARRWILEHLGLPIEQG